MSDTNQTEQKQDEVKATTNPVAEKPAAPAAAAKPAAEKKPVEESPEVIAKREAATKQLEAVQRRIEQKFGPDVLEETSLQKFQPTFVIKSKHWLDVVQYLKDEPSHAFQYPECFAGTDYPAKGYIEVALYLHSMEHDQFITVKTRTPRENAELDSLCPIFIGANWEEREIYDLLGVNFRGHPNLTRIMLEDDFIGHPLRKDFNVWEEPIRPGGDLDG